jgi:hypothetical protein
MVARKVDPKTVSLEVVVRFAKTDLGPKEAWTRGWVNLNAHPKFGIKSRKAKPFRGMEGIVEQIEAQLADAGVVLVPHR